MVNLPKLRHLHYLVALADELHFGRAAERCHVSQSALSKGVQELEAGFGVTLAERTKRQVIITATGHEIVTRARRILREAEDMVDLARASGAPLSGDLRLGVIPTVGDEAAPITDSEDTCEYLRSLRANHPDRFEINLHGYTHDQRTAFYTASEFGGV